MKTTGELVMSGESVDSAKSIAKLKGLGREFDESGHLIKNVAKKSDLKKTVKTVNLLSKEMIPKKNLSNMTKKQKKEKEERDRLLAEAKALEEEAKEHLKEESEVNHEAELQGMTLTDAKLVREYWAGVSLKMKTEQESGKLVYKSDVDAAQFALARQVREKISSRPKMAFKMVGKNIQEIEKILEEEADDIFNILVGSHVS
jgi:MoaA/NifB/PqqE/SkfB family radical SAM enzyme